MRAVVLTGVNRLELRDVPSPPPDAREVRVRVAAVGLCGTDLHIVAGHANYNRDAKGRVIPFEEEPQILGHEIAGVVEDIGRDVADLRAGDRVIIDQGRNCVSEHRLPLCEFCATGDSHQCELYREHGITGLPGGLAEYVTVPAVNAVRIESAVDIAEAALAEPLACVVHSTDLLTRADARYALAASNGQAVRTAVVCGAGPSGLLFVQYLRRVLAFDGRLLVVEPNAKRRALAERFGAETIDPVAADAADVVRERTHGRGAELVIEASGSGAALAGLPRLIRKQATVLLYGHGHDGVDASVLNLLQFMEPRLVSPAGASGGFEPDGRPTVYVSALRLIEAGRIEVGPLITHRYRSLESVPNAFAGDHRSPEYVKGVVLP
jgi:threonine dehydrogenase-like Zn-dependent dehydrogenase